MPAVRVQYSHVIHYHTSGGVHVGLLACLYAGDIYYVVESHYVHDMHCSTVIIRSI